MTENSQIGQTLANIIASTTQLINQLGIDPAELQKFEKQETPPIVEKVEETKVEETKVDEDEVNIRDRAKKISIQLNRLSVLNSEDLLAIQTDDQTNDTVLRTSKKSEYIRTPEESLHFDGCCGCDNIPVPISSVVYSKNICNKKDPGCKVVEVCLSERNRLKKELRKYTKLEKQLIEDTIKYVKLLDDYEEDKKRIQRELALYEKEWESGKLCIDIKEFLKQLERLHSFLRVCKKTKLNISSLLEETKLELQEVKEKRRQLVQDFKDAKDVVDKMRYNGDAQKPCFPCKPNNFPKPTRIEPCKAHKPCHSDSPSLEPSPCPPPKPCPKPCPPPPKPCPKPCPPLCPKPKPCSLDRCKCPPNKCRCTPDHCRCPPNRCKYCYCCRCPPNRCQCNRRNHSSKHRHKSGWCRSRPDKCHRYPKHDSESDSDFVPIRRHHQQQHHVNEYEHKIHHVDELESY